jgi:hypothetical protein
VPRRSPRHNVSTPVFVGMIAATGILLIPMLCVLRCPRAYERNLPEQERGLVRAFAAMSVTRSGTMLDPMTILFDIDPRIARLCPHAGRLQARV